MGKISQPQLISPEHQLGAFNSGEEIGRARVGKEC